METCGCHPCSAPWRLQTQNIDAVSHDVRLQGMGVLCHRPILGRWVDGHKLLQRDALHGAPDMPTSQHLRQWGVGKCTSFNEMQLTHWACNMQHLQTQLAGHAWFSSNDRTMLIMGRTCVRMYMGLPLPATTDIHSLRRGSVR